MDLDTYVELEQRRADTYRRLSICYYLPEQATLVQLLNLEASLRQICPEAASHIAQMKRETDLEQLKVDFSRLFVGPFKLIAPPYGSVHLEPQRAVMGDSTIDAERRYREAGLDIAKSLNDAPDHIAVELEFLYYLIYKEVEAMRHEQPEDAHEWLQKQHAFLTLHIGAWVSSFAEAVEHGAKTDFYRQLANATQTFVHSDQEAVAGYVSNAVTTANTM